MNNKRNKLMEGMIRRWGRQAEEEEHIRSRFLSAWIGWKKKIRGLKNKCINKKMLWVKMICSKKNKNKNNISNQKKIIFKYKTTRVFKKLTY